MTESASADRAARTAGKGEEKLRSKAAETEARVKEAGQNAKQSEEKLRSKVAQAEARINEAAQNAKPSEENLDSKTAQAEAGIREAGQEVKERSDQAMHSVSVFVRDRPLIALGIAFVAGTLLSGLTRRH